MGERPPMLCIGFRIAQAPSDKWVLAGVAMILDIGL